MRILDGCVELDLGAESWETSCSRRSVVLVWASISFFGFLDSFGEAGFVERLQYVVNGVYVEGLDSVVVESGGENYVGNF